MKTTTRSNQLIAIAALSLSIVSNQLTAAPPATNEPNAAESAQAKKRTLPYRGIIGKVDTEKKIFTLKNKSNSEVRIFKIDPKTRFEAGKTPAMIKDLQPNMAVRGSCIKTGERQYLAKLVRWEPSIPRDKTPNIQTN